MIEFKIHKLQTKHLLWTHIYSIKIITNKVNLHRRSKETKKTYSKINNLSNKKFENILYINKNKKEEKKNILFPHKESH